METDKNNLAAVIKLLNIAIEAPFDSTSNLAKKYESGGEKISFFLKELVESLNLLTANWLAEFRRTRQVEGTHDPDWRRN